MISALSYVFIRHCNGRLHFDLPWNYTRIHHQLKLISPRSTHVYQRRSGISSKGATSSTILAESLHLISLILILQQMLNLDLFICRTSNYIQQTSATPQRAPEFRSVQCIGIKTNIMIQKCNRNVILLQSSGSGSLANQVVISVHGLNKTLIICYMRPFLLSPSPCVQLSWR